MARTSKPFNFRAPVAYDDAAKRRFHFSARSRLRRLATVLGLEPGSYDLRSNLAGIAVSGETTLHSDRLYVQVSQSAMGHDSSILFRTCKDGRTIAVVQTISPLSIFSIGPRISRAESGRHAMCDLSLTRIAIRGAS
jgi:hypothetical protein